jgi:hypothetical protein
MAVRIQQTPRRRRRGTTEHAELAVTRHDESALLEATDHVIDLIDEATA